MRKDCWIIVAMLGLLGLSAAAIAAGPSSAAITITGDWNVTGVESYVDEVITVTATNGSTGNVFIYPGGELRLENCTVIMPTNRSIDHQGILEIRNSTIRGTNWFFWLRGPATLQNVSLFNATHDTGSGRSGTVVQSPGVTFDDVRWNRSGGFVPRDMPIHIRVVSDFKNNYVGFGGQLQYELNPLSSSLNIDISRNRFILSTGMFTRTTGISIENVLHIGQVVYNIHDNVFRDGDDHIYLGQSSPSTTYLIHDNTFDGTGSTSIEIGQAGAGNRFGGNVVLYNLSISGGNRVARMYGEIGAGVVGTMNNITILNVLNGIVANEATWIVRNSTITSTAPQYQAESNGHIKIYDTADQSFVANTVGSGGSVEHFIFFNLASVQWQGNVPFLSDNVSFRNGSGMVFLIVNPQNWTPRDIVWWGVYAGGSDVDNRDLRPVVYDGPATFGCSPAQFFVSPGMSALNLVCTDDAAPSVTIQQPAFVPRIGNETTISAEGSVSEYGSGLQTLDYSFDNATWTPAVFGGSVSLWLFYAFDNPDGNFTIYLRAVDRTGLASYISRGPVIVDTALPAVTVGTLPLYTSGPAFALTGSTEPDVYVSFLTTGGLTGGARSSLGGTFTLSIPLVEGVNTFWVSATDAAGNVFTVQLSLLVDNVPPWLVVTLAPTGATSEVSVQVEGLSEVAAVVTVNGNTAARTAEAFLFDMGLVTGLNLITVNATDAAGNRAQWFGAWWFDMDPPTLEASVATGNVSAEGVPVTRVGAVPVTGSVADVGTGVTLLTINGVSYTFSVDGTFAVSLAVVDGDNMVVVVATDRVGNVASRTLHVLRDSTLPTAVATLVPGDGNLSVVEGRTYTAGSTVVVSLAMSEAGEATVQSLTRSVTAGANLFTVPIGEGTNTISITFRDRAGNNGAPMSAIVTRDTTAPAVVLSAPASGSVIDDDFVTVEGVTEAGAAVLVNGVRVAVTAAGGFSTQVAVPTKGATITVTAEDFLGNANSTSVTVSRAAAAVTTVDPGAGGSFLFLVLGLAAGIVVGLVLRGRGRRGDEAPPVPVAAEPHGADPATGAPRPKGPRGPQPPGG